MSSHVTEAFLREANLSIHIVPDNQSGSQKSGNLDERRRPTWVISRHFSKPACFSD